MEQAHVGPSGSRAAPRPLAAGDNVLAASFSSTLGLVARDDGGARRHAHCILHYAPTSTMRRRTKDPAGSVSSSIAWKVALVYLAAGAIWVIGTDLLLYNLVSDRIAIGRIETAKGWIFVALGVAFLFLVTKRAVGRLARSNATITAVVKSISDGVLLIDHNGSIALANPAAERLLGVGDAELVGMSPEEFARRYHVEEHDGRLLDPQNYASQRALSGETPAPYKARIHPPDRPEVVAIVTGAPVRPIPEGPVALAVSVMHDITALERLDEMRDEIVSSAAHTLRTPISIISAHSQLLEDGMTRSWQESTHAIALQCDRLNRITENLIVLARLRTHSLRLKPEGVVFSDLVDDVAREMKEASLEHSLVVRIHAHPRVFADRERLALAIRNLVELAYRRAVPNTDVTIDVDEIDTRGRVCLSYNPVVPLHAPDVGFSGLNLEDYVTEELVRASTGCLGAEAVGHDLERHWVEIPTIEGNHG